MSKPQILVTGATGRLGRVVVAKLQSQGQPVRVLTRQPEQARLLFGDAVDIALGSFESTPSLVAAMQGIERVFLLSPITSSLADQQENLIWAARRAGVARIVKLSGSDWTLLPAGRSISGDAHRKVELALARSGLDHVAIRPNAWMQVALARVLDDLRHGPVLNTSFGDARVSYIDLRDIADVAVHCLLAAELPAQPLVLTGPAAVSYRQLADWAGALLSQPVRVYRLSAGEQALHAARLDLPPLIRAVHGQFTNLIAEGAASGVTDTVSRVLGRPARTVAAWLQESLAAQRNQTAQA